MKKVCSNTAVLIFVLMLMISGSVLTAEDPPSAQDQAVRKAQPVTATPVPPALHQAVAISLGEAASFGTKAIPTPPTGSWGIVSEGDGGGGIFRDTDSEAEAWLGSGGYGVEGFGSTTGGYFKDSDQSGYAYVGYGDLGIQAMGHSAGAFVKDSNGSGYAYVGYGDRGIEASGTEAGGYFYDSDHSGYSFIGYGHYGIWAMGNTAGGYFKDRDNSGFALLGSMNVGIQALGDQMGGDFEDSDQSGYSYVGFGDRGIEAAGNEMGGHFKDSNNSGYANVGEGDYGIRAYGNFGGGYFEDLNSSSDAYVGSKGYGIEAYGSDMGGFFKDTFDSGVAKAGYGDWGIEAYGNSGGGHFFDIDSTSYAYVGTDVYGIEARGSGAGGYFRNFNDSSLAVVATTGDGIYASGDFFGGQFSDQDSSSYGRIGYDIYKIFGSGAVSFVQNHPYDPSSVIVYAAPEGDEVATYTRGTARLVEGEATVPLGETFKWVTNPDIGLTAHLTPREDCNGVYVADLSTEEMVVRELQNGTSDCAFDFLVYGLRIGFEESSIVQEKEMESYIPSMADHRQLYERRPDLKSYNSLERFKGMRNAANSKAELDLSRAHALRDAIIEFDPAAHELPRPPRMEEMTREDATPEMEGHVEGVQSGERVRAARADQDRRLSPDHSGLSAEVPVNDEGNVHATSFHPSSREVASLVDVSEEVQPGDVLVIDRDNPGMMRKGFEAHDTGVIGVVTLDAGVVLGTRPSADAQGEPRTETALRAEVAMTGIVNCRVDAGFGAVWPGDLLVTSPTPGHAMRADAPLPGTVLGKALEPLEEGVGAIKVLVMLR